MRSIVFVVCVLAGCGDAEQDAESGRAKTMAWIDGERARVLDELDAILSMPTPCERAAEWVLWMGSNIGGPRYEAPEPEPLPDCTYRYQIDPPCDDPYLTGSGPADPEPTFLELCEEYLSDDVAECVTAAYLGEAAECCLRETPIYVPSEHNFTDAECEEGWYL
jgi:hypothetical protein